MLPGTGNSQQLLRTKDVSWNPGVGITLKRPRIGEVAASPALMYVARFPDTQSALKRPDQPLSSDLVVLLPARWRPAALQRDDRTELTPELTPLAPTPFPRVRIHYRELVPQARVPKLRDLRPVDAIGGVRLPTRLVEIQHRVPAFVPLRPVGHCVRCIWLPRGRAVSYLAWYRGVISSDDVSVDI